MVSDQDIANGVASVLQHSGADAVTSVTGVMQQLEAKLGLDLSHKAAFIRDQIDLLLHSQPPPPPPPLLQLPGPKDQFALRQLPHLQTRVQPPPPPQLLPQNPPPSSSLIPLQHYPQQQLINFRFPHPVPLPGDAVKPGVAGAGNVPAGQEVQKESTSSGTKRRGGPGGLNKVCGVSPALQAIVGEPTMPRTQIVKQLWAYIRKNNLQDPNNKRKIICNDELKLVFETDCTDMFKMNKLLAKHIIPIDPTSEPGSDTKRLKPTDAEPATGCSKPGPPPMMMSDVLANFFGTGEREMLQPEAEKRLWEYIKINALQDQMNSMVIHCDAKLQELFGCENVSALGISEMLARHFFKQS